MVVRVRTLKLTDITEAVAIASNSCENSANKMADKVSRALNLLGADSDLFSSDGDKLMELINDYWADDNHTVR